MDHLALVQHGIQNVVATSGTALTAQHAKLLKRFTEHAVLVFDGDSAGSAAAVRGVTPLVEAGIDVRIVSLVEGHDPDSFVNEKGRDAFRDLVGDAIPAVDFLIQWAGTLEDLTTADGRARATRRLAEIVSHVGDAALRQFLIRDVAQKLNIDESVVIQEVQRAGERQKARARTGEPEHPVPAIERFDPRPRAERELLIQMMSRDDVADAVLEQIRCEDFTNSVYRYIARLMAYQRENGLGVSVAHMVDCCEHPIVSQIISSMSLETGITNPELVETPLQDYINAFRLRDLNRRIDDLEVQMKTAAGDGLRALMEQHRALTLERRQMKEGAPVA